MRAGKLRHVGASNFTGWLLQKLVDLTDRMGYSPFISLQVELTPLFIVESVTADFRPTRDRLDKSVKTLKFNLKTMLANFRRAPTKSDQWGPFCDLL